MTVAQPTVFLHESMPLTMALGIEAITLTPDLVVLTLDWDESLCTANDILHGGSLMALADSAGGVSAFLNLPDGAVGTSTIESKTNFLGVVADGTVVATARPFMSARRRSWSKPSCRTAVVWSPKPPKPRQSSIHATPRTIVDWLRATLGSHRDRNRIAQ